MHMLKDLYAFRAATITTPLNLSVW